MAFLAPLLLIALAGLAVPLILHLTERERKHVVTFPSLMFLRKIPYRSVRRRRVRHWWLLLMRAVALTLLVLAFARPFFSRAGLSAATTQGAREVVVLLDRSFSMGAAGRWDEAQRLARETVGAFGLGDRGSLVLFSTAAELVVRPTEDRAQLLAAIDRATPSAGATRYAPPLRLAQSVLAESPLTRREVVIVSDFQARGWDRAETPQLPGGTIVVTRDAGGRTPRNLSVAGASLQTAMFEGQPRVTVAPVVASRTDTPSASVAVALEDRGRAMQTVSGAVDANAASTFTFAPVTIGDAGQHVTIRLENDELAADNVFHLNLAPPPSIPVLLVERAGAARESSYFLARALAISTTPTFAVTAKAAEDVSRNDVALARVVILNDAVPGSGVSEFLTEFVASGGGLFLVIADRGRWDAAPPALLPATIGGVVDRQGRGGLIGSVDFNHPALAPFKVPGNGDFGSVRVFRQRGGTLTPQAGTAVMRFDDGGVALAERTSGKGRVLAWMSTLDTFWNDLALKPVFLPFVHRIVEHLAHYDAPRPWYTVGDVLQPLPGEEATVLVNPSGERVPLSRDGQREAVQLLEPGFYELRAGEGAAATLVRSVAVNVDPTESEVARLDPAELAAAITGRASADEAEAAQEEATPELQERRQGLWVYLLVAALVLFAAETFVSSRLAIGG